MTYNEKNSNDYSLYLNDLEFFPFNDHLNFKNNKKILSIIKNEKLLFSSEIKKKNKHNYNQTRNLILTNKALYNLDNYTLKRRIDLSKIKGITTAKNLNELVIHGIAQEHDYYYLTKDKNTIIYLLEKIHEKLTGRELMFAYLEIDNLKNRVTKKDEKKKNPNFCRMDDSELYDINKYIKEIIFKNNKKLDEFDVIDFNILVPKNNTSEINSSKIVNQFLDGRKQSIYSYNIDSFDNSNEEDSSLNNESFEILPEAKIEDFELLKIIGKGKNSITYLAKYINNKNNIYYNKLYAIKKYKKIDIINNELFDNLRNEKKISTFKNLFCSYISKLEFCFQNNIEIFYVFPFYKGGDLFQLLKTKKKLKISETIFFISQIIIALLKLHENSIIYRNIKLENVLIDDKGLIKLIDFNKCKILTFENEFACSFIGNLEYISPEVILGNGHSFEYDYWMLGILTYYLIFGHSPYKSKKIDNLFDEIIFEEIEYNENEFEEDGIYNKKDIIEFIKSCLEKNKEKRINDDNIKNKKIFININWDEIENGELFPTLIQNISEKDDYIKNFDENLLNEKIESNEYLNGFDLQKIKYYNDNKYFNFID